MNEGFVARSLRTYAVVLFIFLPFGFYYFGTWKTIAVLSGGVWGIVNILFLTALVRASIRPDGMQKERTAVLALIKFPVLYASAFGLLKVSKFEVMWLLVGFTGILLVMVLKAIARVLLGLDQLGNKEIQSTL